MLCVCDFAEMKICQINDQHCIQQFWLAKQVVDHFLGRQCRYACSTGTRDGNGYLARAAIGKNRLWRAGTAFA